MKLDLHIERLVIDGSPLGPGQEGVLERAVAEELRGLLLAGGIDGLGELGGLAEGGARPTLAGGSVDWRPASGAGGLGRAIARAAHDGLTGPGGGRRGGAP
jgi:hypothetical protein